MDEVNDPAIETIVLMASSQVGKTETLLNITGYFMEQDPCPILLIEPTLEIAEAYSKTRLAPMIRDTPVLRDLVQEPRSKDSGNTLLHKALALDTPIPTPCGWTTMGEIKVGDFVFDENGKRCKVTHTTEIMRDRPCYAVKFSDDETIVADADHIWPVEEWCVIKRRGHAQQTIIPQLLSTAQIAPRVRKADRFRYAVQVAKPLNLAALEMIPIDPYVLGVWLGNGLSHRAWIVEGHTDAEEMGSLLAGCGHSVTARAPRSAAVLVLDRNDGVRNALGQMTESRSGALHALRSLNLLNKVGDPSEKHIPKQYLRASEDQRLSLLQGLMDTDGHVRPKDGLCVFTTSLPRLAEDIGDLLAGLGFKFHRRTVASYYKKNGERNYCKTSFRFEFMVYPERHIFRLSRKLSMQARYIRSRPQRRRQIVAVDKVPSVPVRCITVDSRSHLYLAGRRMVPTHNSFPGGNVTMVGANSPSGLASRPIRVILADEISRYLPSAGTEGNPLRLADRRATTFWNRKKVYISSPGILGMCNVTREFENSDQQYFHVPCYHCGRGQVLEFKHLRWDSGKPETAHYVCSHCSSTWNDAQRIEAVMAAEDEGMGWAATAEFKGTAGHSIWAIYSPWMTHAEIAKTYVDAKHALDQGDPEPLKTWTNTVEGRAWVEVGQRASPDPLIERLENYSAESLPWQVLYLTAAIDTQDDRLEVKIIGWRANNRVEPPEAWVILHKLLYGDPSQSQLWNDVDQLILREYRTMDGRALRVAVTAVDSGGHHAESVYRFCNKRMSRRVYAIKGSSGPRPIWPPRAGASKKYQGTKVFLVGVDTAKDAIFARLKVAAPGPGYIHFPVTSDHSGAFDLKYFQQLTCEFVKTKFIRGHAIREWFKPIGARNEAFDLMVYNLAALQARQVPWEILARAAPSEPPPKPDDDTPPGTIAPPATLAPARPPAQRLPPMGGGGRRVRIRIR